MEKCDHIGQSLTGRRCNKLWAVSTLFFLLLFAVPINAQERIIEVAAWRFPPYAYVDSSGELRGIAVETVKEVLIAMGYKPKMVLMPFKRCLMSMQQGSMPLMLPCAFSDERSKYLRYSQPIYHITTHLWHRDGDTDCWDDYPDLIGLRIGVGLGYSYGKQWDEAVAKYNLKLQPTPGNSAESTHFLMLDDGRIDMFISDFEVGKFVKNQGAPRFDNIYPCPKKIDADRPFGAAISRAYFNEHDLPLDDFLNRFNTLLEEIAPH